MNQVKIIWQEPPSPKCEPQAPISVFQIPGMTVAEPASFPGMTVAEPASFPGMKTEEDTPAKEGEGTPKNENGSGAPSDLPELSCDDSEEFALEWVNGAWVVVSSTASSDSDEFALADGGWIEQDHPKDAAIPQSRNPENRTCFGFV